MLVVLQTVSVLTGLSFTSDTARNLLSEQIQILTQRDVHIDGEVRMTVSLFPQMIIERIHIRNHEGFGYEDFITLSEARVELSLLSLLTRNIHFADFVANQATIGFILREDGKNNWSFGHLLERSERDVEVGGQGVQETKGKRRIVVIDRLVLTDITVTYTDLAGSRVINKHFSRLSIDVKDTPEPQAEIAGSMQAYPYEFTLKSDPLEKLSLNEPWNVRASGTIAGRDASMDAVIQLHDQGMEGSIDFKLEDINLGLLLEQTGIIEKETVVAKKLKIDIESTGADIREFIRNADIDLQLQHGYWRWQALPKDSVRELAFNSVAVLISWNKPVRLHLDGRLLSEVIELDFKTNKLSEFFDDKNILDIDLIAHVAGSDIVLKGTLDLPVEKKSFVLDISFNGNELEKLNTILDSEFPPFNDYSLAGTISANRKGFVVRADDASIGNTHFKATIVIDTSAFKPFWTINLNSRQLQIEDFEFADLGIEIPDAKAISSGLRSPGESGEMAGRGLERIVNNPKMHFDLNLKVENVLAGEAALGPSSFSLKLRDNTLILHDAEFAVPAGKIKSSLTFRSEDDQVKGTLQLDIDKFDYGAVTRYFKLGDEEGGVVSARIDLELGGRDFSRLFDHATGKLDVALWPRDTKTELFDIWANALFLIILPEIKKKQDRINCIVALLDLKDGIMNEDFFGIDTRKVWMYGDMHVDFRNEQLKLALYPRAKKAKLFALQAPIRAEGNFDNIGLTTTPVDLTVAYLSFVTSPLHVPVRRLLGERVPEDESRACEKLFDREYLKQLKERIELEEQKEIDEWLDSD